MWTTAAAQPSQHWPRTSAMTASTGANCCQLLCYSSWSSLFHFAQGWDLLPLSLFDSNSFRRSVITSQSGVGAEAWGAMLSWQCGRLPAHWHWPILGYSIVSFSAVENRAFCKTLLHSEQQMPWWKSYCWERMQLWFEDSQLLKVKTKWFAIVRDKAEWQGLIWPALVSCTPFFIL